MNVRKPPKLPQLLDRKIYKTGQTRGADDDVIYQNRVNRSSTVLIPYKYREMCALPDGRLYDNAFIVLLSPADYFENADIERQLAANKLCLGKNALVFYETRKDWEKYHPDLKNWTAAKRRRFPLGGQYVARIPATTATKHGGKIICGFDKKPKGAGIRVFEYAGEATISDCRLQLEALYWHCADADVVVRDNGMSSADAEARKQYCIQQCHGKGLLDYSRLRDARILNVSGKTICPLCLEELSAQGFFSRMEQAEGREVNDLTVTQLNLFNIAELRLGQLNHRPYR